MELKYFCKGKTLDEKKWVRGNVIVSEKRYFIVPEFGVSCIEDGSKDEWAGDTLIILHAFEVDPDTICKYTGVKDRNGKWIFEKDIVRREVISGYIQGSVVWFNIGRGGFYLQYGGSFYPIGRDEHSKKSSRDEVIGNVLDEANMEWI